MEPEPPLCGIFPERLFKHRRSVDRKVCIKRKFAFFFVLDYLLIVIHKPGEDTAAALHVLHAPQIGVYIQVLAFFPAYTGADIDRRLELFLMGLQIFSLVFYRRL